MKIGIVGAGQLARMIALAGYPLEMQFLFLDPSADACAAPLGELLLGDYDDPALLQRLAAEADVVTYEFENVPPASIAYLEGHCPVYPNSRSLATARDRLHEKTLLNQLGIVTAPFAAVDSLAELQQAVSELGLPAVLKTRTLGYDGKGQAVLRKPDDIEAAWQQLGGVPLILEGFVNFTREVSIIAVRGRDGECRFYPLAENTHRNGILHLSVSCPNDPLQGQAEAYADKLLAALDYVGVMALELFQADDTLIANEMAPRVHNSGHWSIEGAETSQFENHLRAIAGLPLGSTAARGHAAMLNYIGELPDTHKVLAAGAHLHRYGKAPRPGRKVAHATVCATDAQALQRRLTRLLAD
ncbi:MAG: 5-(carboxyamino)imidazole ribonucleotide synthase [Chromatiales bacterium]|nr:5-(carboxyamino)imidazole ribonucleotide synthase [Gammaproteobacteria bacterium]MBW6477707.1 5-(carboxyamino)imidazole ribonucleotide synthase [Chromatiales bacterium]